MSKGKQAKRRTRGRPRLPVGEAKRHAVGFRTTRHLKDKLEKAAKASGRSVAQEVEFRLEGSFRAEALLGEVMTLNFGRWLAGLLALIGRTMKHAGWATAVRELDERLDVRTKMDQLENWHRIPAAFDEAVLAGVSLLQAVVRPGDPIPKGAVRTVDPITDILVSFKDYAPGWNWGRDFVTRIEPEQK